VHYEQPMACRSRPSLQPRPAQVGGVAEGSKVVENRSGSIRSTDAVGALKVMKAGGRSEWMIR
jgi:hypothetical protein